jgi:DNA-directed RNA polymerase specialized sigma subunit
MTTKEYLNQVYRIDRRINVTLAKIEKMRASLYKIGAGGSSVPAQRQSSDSLGAAIAKVMDYEKNANRLIDELVTKRLEIENAIKGVQDAVQREVLERRYLLFQRWESRFDERTGEYVKGIAESMGYSERQIYRLHGKALKNVSVNVSERQL